MICLESVNEWTVISFKRSIEGTMWSTDGCNHSYTANNLAQSVLNIELN